MCLIRLGCWAWIVLAFRSVIIIKIDHWSNIVFLVLIFVRHWYALINNLSRITSTVIVTTYWIATQWHMFGHIKLVNKEMLLKDPRITFLLELQIIMGNTDKILGNSIKLTNALKIWGFTSKKVENSDDAPLRSTLWFSYVRLWSFYSKTLKWEAVDHFERGRRISHSQLRC